MIRDVSSHLLHLGTKGGDETSSPSPSEFIEWESWIDDEAFDFVDLRKFKPKNHVTGRWVLTIKTDKHGNFLRAKARWVPRGFQDKQKEYLQTASPAPTRTGFRMSCQRAASRGWDLFHIDLKTAFLQGQSYDVNRDVVCQLPPEAGHPPSIAASLKKLAYGMNDAPRRWWNIHDKALRTCGMILTRAYRCCCVLYSIQSRERAREHLGKGAVAQQNDTNDAFTKLREQSEMEAATAGSPATGKSVAGIINLFVDDLFGTGGNEMEQRFLTRLRKDFQIGSEDWNDVTLQDTEFAGQDP